MSICRIVVGFRQGMAGAVSKERCGCGHVGFSLVCVKYFSTFSTSPPGPLSKALERGSASVEGRGSVREMVQSPDLYNFFSDESPFPNALGKGRGWGWLVRVAVAGC